MCFVNSMSTNLVQIADMLRRLGEYAEAEMGGYVLAWPLCGLV